MREDQIWSCLPAVITKYDGVRANVRPLVKLRYKDGSNIDFPEIYGVQVITQGTAFAGIKMPVRVGDKVVLHIADRDIQKLLNGSTTAGLGDTGSVESPTQRKHNISDAIAYTGFYSMDSVKTDPEYDLWIFNNDDSDSYNHVRLKQNGDIEVKTKISTMLLEKEGDISLQNDTCSFTLENSGDINLQNQSSLLSMGSSGEVLLENSLGSVLIAEIGNITITSPLLVTIDTPLLNCTGEIAAGNNAVHMTTHFHGGVLSGPAITSPPSNPS
jgi:hypothetical protein